MTNRQRYKKLGNSLVSAVQLSLDFQGFIYQKWKADQRCERDDWLVNNAGDVYTVKNDYFINNYIEAQQGVYMKQGSVWAEIATDNGSIDTREGKTAHSIGDYLVFDRPEGGDGYAVDKQRFEQMYQLMGEGSDLPEDQHRFVEETIRPALISYKSKSNNYKIIYFGLQSVTLLCGVIISVASAIDSLETSNMLILALGAISSISAGLLALFQFGQSSARYADSAFALRRELQDFENNKGRYEGESDAFHLLYKEFGRIDADLFAQLPQRLQTSQETSK